MAADIFGFGTTVVTSRDPADRASVRRGNLGMILRRLRDHGPRARTLLAEETGLPKATISNLVAELTGFGLVRDGEFEPGVSPGGRPRQAVELDGRGVCGIGVEINTDYVSIIALDLRGTVVFEDHVAADVPELGVEGTLDTVAGLLRESLTEMAKTGIKPVGVTLVVPGRINAATGGVTIAANLRWRNVVCVPGLRERLGADAPPIAIANDARLGTIAEYVEVAGSGVVDLLYVTGEVGVAGGVIAGGREHHGAHGAALEIGHLQLNPEPVPCTCGRHGCFETMVGLGALLRLAADVGDPVRDPWTDREQRLSEIRRRAEAGDPRTLAALHQVAASLGSGVTMLVSILDPELVILGGYFAFLGEYLIDEVQRAVDDRVLSSDADTCTVALSAHGSTSAVRGGAQLSLEAVFQDPGRAAV